MGVPRKGNEIQVYSLPLHFGKIITGSHGGESVPQDDIPRYHNMYLANRISLQELITEKYSLEDVNIAIDNMRNGQASGRCLIRF